MTKNPLHGLVLVGAPGGRETLIRLSGTRNIHPATGAPPLGTVQTGYVEYGPVDPAEVRRFLAGIANGTRRPGIIHPHGA